MFFVFWVQTEFLHSHHLMIAFKNFLEDTFELFLILKFSFLNETEFYLSWFTEKYLYHSLNRFIKKVLISADSSIRSNCLTYKKGKKYYFWWWHITTRFVLLYLKLCLVTGQYERKKSTHFLRWIMSNQLKRFVYTEFKKGLPIKTKIQRPWLLKTKTCIFCCKSKTCLQYTV